MLAFGSKESLLDNGLGEGSRHGVNSGESDVLDSI